ncbi:NAD(P)-binding protein [Parathielavia appendiculata]|uniref:NAD(P)-binding protein n=1 Tax=Parathielavia appendiculata TaxID=2587402 RepID=A0AAN6YZP7_9PEZI|nr:NAD(P)-binding protein [Parathielavia appendiculata]
MAPSSITLNVPYIKTLHKKPYPAISPSRPELSQAGRTVLVVGGSSGIGFAIAKAFIQASASRVIITGRQQNRLDDAVSRLRAENVAGTVINALVTDMSDLESTEKLWNAFRDTGVVIDVLILNAAGFGKEGPILQAGLESTWAVFETNVRGLLDYAVRFHQQPEGRGEPKFLVNLSSSAAHNLTTDNASPTYGLTKNSGTLLMQMIAHGTDPKDMQIISMHPGGVLTDAARSAGYDETTLDWDDENLPGQFAVWCASKEAQFLHGRFIPVWWDVDEIKTGEVRRRIESEYHFLRVGIVGL